MLAASSIGAVWSSCSPDFGVQGVLDRFGQIEPRVLFCADSYAYAGKEIDCLARVAEVVAKIPSIETVVVVAYGDRHPDIYACSNAVMWDDFASTDLRRCRVRAAAVRSSAVHPVFVGTTGLPKCMVHGAGGTLLQHLKELMLHTDLKRSDRVFYFTTCGWMMWNWLASALAVGSTLVLYDGAPFSPKSDSLWEMASAEKLHVFGTSAKYLAMCEKNGPRARAVSRSEGVEDDTIDWQSARAPQLRLCVFEGKAGRASLEHQRRHRHRVVLRGR